MAKKGKTFHRWRVTVIKGTPANSSAVEAAAREFRISDVVWNRLVA